MSSHEARLHELNRRITEIDEALLVLQGEYDSMAVTYTTDKETLREAARHEEKVAWLQRERALAVKAGEQVLQQAKNEALAAGVAQRRAALTKVREIADATAALNIEIDDRLVALRQALERRANLLRELAMTEVANTVVVKLQGKGPVNRALAAVGLHKFIDFSTPAPGSFVPLANANVLLASVGKESPTVKPNGGGGNREDTQP
jgi:hypothetical protein